MRNTLVTLLITLFMGAWLSAQVKIGDNPQNIDPASVLELESTDKVLVITRVTTAQMNAIVPSQGALCYNTELQAVHYYNGTQWLNIGSGGGTGGPLTADPIVNPISTIVITPTATGDNLEVAPNSISSEQIIDGGVNGIDIQDGSIGPGKLQNNSVTEEKLSENSVGSFALDNDNIDLGDFNNMAGYVTGAELRSNDTGNALQLGTDIGLYYDETPLMNSIQDNTDLINAIGVPNLNDVLQQGNNALNFKIEGLAAPTNPADAATKAYVDAQAAAGGSDNQNIGPLSFTGNVLSIGIEDGMADTIDLSSLAGGTADGSETIVIAGTNVTVTGDGTTATPYVVNSTGGGSGDGSETIVTAGTNITVTGDGTTAIPYVINSTGSGANQNLSQVLAQDNDAGAVKIINLTNPTLAQDAATKAYVDAAVTSGGSLTLDNLLVGDAMNTPTEVPIANIPLSDFATATDSISMGNFRIKELLDPTENQDAATKAYVDATVTGGGSLTLDNILVGDAMNTPTEVPIANIPLSDFATATDSISMGNFRIKELLGPLEDQDAATKAYVDANGGSNNLVEVLNDSLIIEDAGGRLGVPIDSITPKGTPKAVFYADQNGKLTTADDNDNVDDDLGFYWDPSGRPLGAQSFGALFIGLDAENLQSNVAKVHIADNFPGVAYALQIQNRRASIAGRSTGILFSTEDTGNHGKGALVYEGKNINGANARGSFHFLQNNNDDTSVPSLVDSVVTIRQTGDLALHRNLIARNGAGTNGQVLTTNMAGETVWAAAGGIGTLNENNIILGDALNAPQKVALNTVPLSELGTATDSINLGTFRIKNLGIPLEDNDAATKKYVDDNAGGIGTLNESNIILGDALNAPQKVALNTVPLSELGTATDSINLGTFRIKNLGIPLEDNDAATKKYVDDNAGANLFSTNLTLANQRTHDLDGNNFILGGSGDVAIGTLPGAPISKLDVNGQISARNGFAASEGSAGNPGYGFFTNNDTDTGMYRVAEDQIGFSVGGFEALRIDEPTTGNTNVIVNNSLELREQLLDKDAQPGLSGQILSSTATATDWIDAPDGAVEKGRITIAGATLGNYTITFPTALASANYIINTTVQRAASGNPTMIQVTAQTAAGFSVQINEFTGGAFVPVDAIWFYTIYNP